MAEQFPIAVLISGRGTNLAAIHHAILAGTLDARIGAVCSNRPDAYGVGWAREQGLPVAVLSRAEYGSRSAAQEAMLAHLQTAGVELIVLAGWDQILIPAIVAAFDG